MTLRCAGYHRRMLLLLIACTGGSADDSASLPASGDFSALSYNVHGLPEAVTGDDTAGRIAQIAPLLEPFDLIGLQEDWDADNHAVLDAAVSHETREYFDEKVEEGRYYGSGLALFARWPETALLEQHYSTCSGLLDGASDCLASKGFVALRLRLGQGELDVYNTHMEAGGGEEDDVARAVHVDELLAAMAGFSAGRAILFMGDTNLHGDDPEDAPLIAKLMEGAGLLDGCEAVGCEDPGRIDKMLFRDGEGVSLSPTSWEVAPGFVDEQGVDLSDHEPIHMDWSWAAG